ncbi:hypothetical protein CIL03_00850 [Virgibacillus indicus]|uniref:Type 4 fimbrial biogenesis protein PilX N-terminal domain-containing protein n=1 Tax=Virgibacillus indicus TaxID=2024554 RepID=A0A265ND35_9BACI|nr:hypothetical protein [Virgibacillus indicus]OZU89721.1 hypothetical protein CIL03_00850 [Virgibacillus indicus]
MKKFNNEQGAALVITLFIVTILLLLVLSLFYQVTNTTKQITATEENMGAIQIAEMGIVYYEQVIEAEKQHLEQVLNENGEDALLDELNRINNSLKEKVNFNDSKNRFFKLSIDTNSPRIETSDSQSKIIIKFNSIGKVSSREKMVDSEIVINIEGQLESGAIK